MMLVEKTKWHSVILSLIGLLAAIYLLSYTGRPISDDEQLYASVARNIAVLDRLGAEQLYGNLRLKGDYHGVEPAHPALASFLLRVFSGINFGGTQILYLLPILYTIICCVLVAMIARQLGYSILTGVTISLIYGLSTIAWPYAKTFFREPLAIVLLLGTWFMYLKMKQPDGWKRYIYGAVIFVLLLFLALVKVVFISACIAILVIWLMDKREKGAKTFSAKIWPYLIVIIVLVLGEVFFTRRVTDQSIYYRFTGGFISDVTIRIFAISHTRFWEAFLAPLVSPLKGLIFYSPVILLGFVSCIMNGRKYPQLFVFPMTLLIIQLLVQALIYDSEWLTPTWGSRFLLPVIPLLLISSLPLVDDLLGKYKWGKMVLLGFFIPGIIIQLPGVLFNSSLFFAQTYAYDIPGFFKVLWNPLQTPILRQWQMADIPEYDLLIWRVFPSHPTLVTAVILGAIILAVLSVRWLHEEIHVPTNNPGNKFTLKLLITLTFILFLMLGTLTMGTFDPFYHIMEFQPLCDQLRSNIQKDDLVIVYSYPGELWDYFSNAECGQGMWYSLPYLYYEDPDSLAYAMGEKLFSRIKGENYSRLWFISQYDSDSLSEFEEAEFESGDYYFLEDGYFDYPVRTYYVLYELK